MDGKRYELKVLASLRSMGATVVSSSALDHQEKTDALCTRLRGGVIAQPVRLQLTFRRDEPDKMAAFRKVCDQDFSRGLYVEMENGCHPDQVASAIIRTLHTLQNPGHQAERCHAIRVLTNDLRDCSPKPIARTAHVPEPARLRGMLCRKIGGSYAVQTFSGTMYQAFPTDLLDRALEKELASARQGKISRYIEVEFTPGETEGQRRARRVSIINKK